jgi:hypothetical protein
MKTLMFSIALLMGGIMIAAAQEQPTTNINLTGQLQELCSLSPEQVAKVKPIVAAFEQKRDDSYKEYHTNPSALSVVVQQNRWNYETALIGILTPAQMGLLKAFDQLNPQIMTYSCSHINNVDYLVQSK